MILRAKWVVPVAAPPIENGAVEVEGDMIVAVGPATGEGRDLGEVALMPGLINAHCHLDYTNMRGLVPWQGRFVDWLIAITELKRQWTEGQFLRSIQHGLRQAVATGTTTIVNIECFPALIPNLGAIPARVLWCPELIDLGQTASAEQLVAAARGHEGLSPHALYTASAELYRACRGAFVTTHLAESVEEDEMFRRGSGPLYERLAKMGRDMSDCGHAGPVELANRLGILGPDSLAAHMNCLTAPEIDLVRASGTHVVHCPRTHRFFQRDRPLLDEFRNAGINVCLGTDSLASNDSLDMFAEMRELAGVHSPVEILAMATINPARALKRPLGRIVAGAQADLIAVPVEGKDPLSAVVFAEKPVCFSMIAGKVVLE